jgi:hypothetical protein
MFQQAIQIQILLNSLVVMRFYRHIQIFSVPLICAMCNSNLGMSEHIIGKKYLLIVDIHGFLTSGFTIFLKI